MKPSVRFFFGVLAWVLRPLADILMGREWIDLDKLPKDKGFILCPNHCTEIDPVVVGHMVYNQNIMPHFLAKDGLFKTPVVGTIMRGANQVPVERSGAGAGRSLEVAQGIIDNGGAVIVYPEGTLTRDPDLWPMRGRTGAARLALNTGAQIIPVAHWGAQEVFPRYAKRFKIFPRKKVRVLIGDPVDLSKYAGSVGDKATLEAMTNDILDDITALLEKLRGEKAPAVRWDPAKHSQAAHGRFEERGAAESETQAETPQDTQDKNDDDTQESGNAQ